jgi:hypothetical protein
MGVVECWVLVMRYMRYMRDVRYVWGFGPAMVSFGALIFSPPSLPPYDESGNCLLMHGEESKRIEPSVFVLHFAAPFRNVILYRVHHHPTPTLPIGTCRASCSGGASTYVFVFVC